MKRNFIVFITILLVFAITSCNPNFNDNNSSNQRAELDLVVRIEKAVTNAVNKGIISETRVGEGLKVVLKETFVDDENKITITAVSGSGVFNDEERTSEYMYTVVDDIDNTSHTLYFKNTAVLTPPVAETVFVFKLDGKLLDSDAVLNAIM